MSRLRAIVREPLLQFLVIGICVFAASALLPESAPGTNTIVVTDGRIHQLAALFERTWQRPPTAAERQGLIEAFVKEEILYREAVAIGLDRDDAVVRQRMAQKMTFLFEPEPDALAPTEAELQAFLDANPEPFAIPPRLDLQQVFFRGTDEGRAAAGALLASLRQSNVAGAPEEAGEATLLPRRMADATPTAIANRLGTPFADALSGLPVGEWSGPLASPFGFHLVRIDRRRDGRRAELDAVRDRVAAAWTDERRRALENERYTALRKTYDVTIEPPAHDDRAGSTAAVAAPDSAVR